MPDLRLQHSEGALEGFVPLESSKSLSNRALIILALAGADPAQYLSRLSGAADTQVLAQHLFRQSGSAFDVGEAGTAYRFLCAYLALQPGTQGLSGSERMLQRPIGPLVVALRSLGADIRYGGQDNFPPLEIGPFSYSGQRTVSVAAHVSSQFLSALAMIGPYLPEGLVLELTGNLVSRPYLDMTLQLMRYFGAAVQWEGRTISIEPGRYQARSLTIEADWSAASYWYSALALAQQGSIVLEGLALESLQGDAVLRTMMEKFSIQTSLEGPGRLRLQKIEKVLPPIFEFDFTENPDLVQTFAVLCAGLGVQGLFSGLDTLTIKETDRIAALRAELKKLGVSMSKLPPHFSKKFPERQYFLLSGKASWDSPVAIDTHNDHRMAMSFAPLAMLHPIVIRRAEVVAKSYPAFWEHLAGLGFSCTETVD